MNSQVTLLILLLSLLSGCVAMQPPQSIDGSPMERVSSIDESHLFAVNQSGTRVALSDDGVSLIELKSSAKKVVSRETPSALAWAPDGSQFSAAFLLPDGQSLVAVYSATGALVREHILPVTANRMTWTADKELLVAGYSLKVYSFGSNLSQALAVIKDENVDLIKLTDVTLKPVTTKLLQPVLHEVLPVLFSSLGDELVYVRLHDPPEFAPYLNVLYLNWQAGNARKLLKLPLQAVELDWLALDLAEVVASGGQYKLELWPATVASGGESPQYRFKSGRLTRGKNLVADWGRDAKFQQAGGGHFMLATKRALYLGGGLDSPVAGGDKQNERRLRRWRYQGLISPTEYQQLLQEKR